MSPILISTTVVFGLLVGSFINVVIYRLPRGQSIVGPRSFCPQCKKKIRWYENIPVFSYIFLRGKCNGCGGHIVARYPIVEMVGGALALLVLYRFGLSIDAAFVFSFLMALLAVTFIDWSHRIIPDEISLSFILIGFVWSFINTDVSPLSSVMGAVTGGGGLYVVGLVYRLIRHAEGMGGGDIKLMAMIGACLGLKLVLPVIVIASFFGSIYGVALIRSGKGGKAAVAFGSFLAPSAAFCLLYGSKLLTWYFGRY
ncbi:MAG: prepilin peptidase [Candidatus Krumholzibacteria bacterium]|nr:prepilin peptidase [Candidatus Krumholzibacteria bacterium]